MPVWSCRNRTIVESIHLFLSPICSIPPEVRHNNMKLTVLNQVRLWFVLLRWIWLSTSMIYQYEPKVNEGHSGSRFEQNDAWAKSIKDYDASFSCQLLYYLQMCLDDPMKFLSHCNLMLKFLVMSSVSITREISITSTFSC